MRPVKAAAVVGVSLLLGLAFDWLFVGKVPGVSVLLYVGAVAAGLYGLARSAHRGLPASVRWLLLPLGFFAAMVAVRASQLLTFLNLLACLLLLLLIATLVSGRRLRGFDLRDYARVPLTPLRFVAPLGRTLAGFFALRSTVLRHPRAARITKGVLLALPVLAVFTALLGSADLVFQGYLKGIFSLRLDGEAVARTGLVGLVALGFTGAYAYAFRPAADQPPAPRDRPAPFGLGHVEASIVLGSVNGLFFLFILIQVAYLFGGLHNISGGGFTYAEYARKGFFELLAVALGSFVVVWLADKFSAAHRGRTFRILGLLLIGQVMVIMASAFKRLYLYEQAFGFTTLRLYSHVFVVFLAVVFVLLAVKLIRRQAEARFAFPTFVTAVVFLAGMNLLNPEAFIARQNLDRYRQTGKLDAWYVGRLSADARGQQQAALELVRGDTKRQLVLALEERPAPSDWQSWNLARDRAGR